MQNFQVAIDGPAGSGKSTISKKVCDILGFTHIDTGAMYRAVTLEALNRGVDLENPESYAFLNIRHKMHGYIVRSTRHAWREVHIAWLLYHVPSTWLLPLRTYIPSVRHRSKMPSGNRPCCRNFRTDSRLPYLDKCQVDRVRSR